MYGVCFLVSDVARVSGVRWLSFAASFVVVSLFLSVCVSVSVVVSGLSSSLQLLFVVSSCCCVVS